MANYNLDDLISNLKDSAALLERAGDILDYLDSWPKDKPMPAEVKLRTGMFLSGYGLCLNLGRSTGSPELLIIQALIAKEFDWYSGEGYFPVEGAGEYGNYECKYTGEYGQRRKELLQALIKRLRELKG